MKRLLPGLLFLLVSLFFLPSKSFARHIIGGDITYECLGGGDYIFTLKMYRDCNCDNCADFDSPARIGIYECNGRDCSSLGRFDAKYRLDVGIESIKSVAAPDYPCLIPPDVCVQEALYVFKLSDYGVRLENNGVSYHVSYQRCCRNQTINNIIGPDNVGATYTIEITTTAQDSCNNSPVFNSFPPTVICAGAALEFDHSATDPDGDQLVYEFCPPLTGGGPILSTPQYSSCEGAQPDPACPPPYGNVSFIVPTYTAKAPMGGNPVISIDPNTGLITGTPDVLGQFVVGVCVSEYRNGVLLSKVFRDFQFNVASCDPTVIADVKEDAVVGDQEFLINSCGDFEISFENESYQRRFIDFFEWRFNFNGEIVTSNEWSPTFTFPGVGDYEGELILNPGTDCGDTAKIYVNLFPSIEAGFEYEYDTCFAGDVKFTDLSTTGAERIVDWNWNFGDGNSSVQQNPLHQYRSPGEIPVSLTVTDNNECEDTFVAPISYFPVPALIVIAPSSFAGCVPADIFFDNLSFPIDSTYEIEWDFGDGGTSGEISPTYTYQDPGDFTVDVKITSPIGCETDTTFNGLISMQESPKADFTIFPENPSSILPTVDLTDQSERAASWFYDFGNTYNTFERNPSYTYPDTGMYVITQIVTHPNGCQDTLSKMIDIQPEVRYFLPNAFTPNGDSVNDEYRGVGLMDGSTDFVMNIWNRWGELVFQAENPDDSWNGRKFNNGQEVPNGVYVVQVSYKSPRGEKIEVRGFATLIR